MPDFFGASCGLPHRLAGKGKEATHMSDNGNHHRWRPGGRDGGSGYNGAETGE